MKRAIIVSTVFALLVACSKSTMNSTTSGNSTSIDCTGITKSFSLDVKPIIQSSCATGSNCHATGSNNGPGELTTYSEIEGASAQIRAAILSGTMPKTGSLSISEKTAIICWIDNGSSNN
jgi:hypothetical protein